MKKLISIVTLTFICLCASLLIFNAKVVQVEASPTYLDGWAWSSNIGWVNLDQVKLERTTGNLSGYAWSSNIGWIKFGGLENSLKNYPANGSLPQANLDMKSGVSSGFIRACAGTANGDCSSMVSRTDGWDGWIELSGLNHSSVANNKKFAQTKNTVGVQLDIGSGSIYGMAWGGPVVGWMNFDASIAVASFTASCGGSWSTALGRTTFIATAKGGSGDYRFEWNKSGVWSTNSNFEVMYDGTTPVKVVLAVKDNASGTILNPSCPSVNVINGGGGGEITPPVIPPTNSGAMLDLWIGSTGATANRKAYVIKVGSGFGLKWENRYADKDYKCESKTKFKTAGTKFDNWTQTIDSIVKNGDYTRSYKDTIGAQTGDYTFSITCTDKKTKNIVDTSTAVLKIISVLEYET